MQRCGCLGRRTRNSYFSPAECNAKDESFRGKVLWKPRDNLTFKLTYELDHVGVTGNGSNAFPVFTNKVPVYSGGSINDPANPRGQAPSNCQNINTVMHYGILHARRRHVTSRAGRR